MQEASADMKTFMCQRQQDEPSAEKGSEGPESRSGRKRRKGKRGQVKRGKVTPKRLFHYEHEQEKQEDSQAGEHKDDTAEEQWNQKAGARGV